MASGMQCLLTSHRAAFPEMTSPLHLKSISTAFVHQSAWAANPHVSSRGEGYRAIHLGLVCKKKKALPTGLIDKIFNPHETVFISTMDTQMHSCAKSLLLCTIFGSQQYYTI